MEPIIVDRRGYCGTNALLPDGYTHFGTGYECLRKGVGVGKMIAENRRPAPVILRQNIAVGNVPIANIPPVNIQPGNLPLIELPELELPEVRLPRKNGRFTGIYIFLLILSYLVTFVLLTTIFQNIKPKFILNPDGTISDKKLYGYVSLSSLGIPFVIISSYFFYKLIQKN